MEHPDDILDPRHYAKVRLPLLEAETLPPWCYTSPDFHQREVERIFMRHWIFIGRGDRIPNPGDYVALDLAGVPIIVARDDDGGVRAFANTCRHRGTRLADGDGNCRAFSCPYHGWAYALDGRLVSIAGMEQTENFDKQAHGLIPVRLESWEGFLFVNFAENGPDLAEQLGELPGLLASHGLSDWVCTRRREYDLACNWKLCLENQRESYHVATVHRGTLSDQFPAQLSAVGQWSGSHFVHDGTIAAKLGAEKVLPRVASLDGPAAEGTYFIAIYPASFLVFTVDCMWWMEFQPLGPRRTKVVVGSCFPQSTVERPDFAEVVEAYYARLDASHPEDNDAAILQQRGLESPHAGPGRLSVREVGVHAVDNWVLDQVLGTVG